MHQHLLQHTLGGLLPPNLPFNLLQLSALQATQPTHPPAGSSSSDVELGASSSSSIIITPPTRPTKKQSNTSGKNYCDVCNKEVCNKYFLRTHMLKMHGIVIDENKLVIANIDTNEREKDGSIAFR
ncbi:unnamed protein product [Gongylonema pulchrum]|uniref:C2H2-type domain-containing protein n=1 Tax=Gongylonema pulchrum TaxID=637853 RepID=A0A3P7R637_9BILA|nr:unnamed protein product [Gongylonema pulchrum]